MIWRFLFEDVLLLTGVLPAVELGLVIIWARRRDRASAQALWAGVGAGLVLVVVSTLVVTPREQVVGTCREIPRAVDDGDVLGIAEHLADDFASGGMDRSRFLERVESTLTRFRIDQPHLSRFEVTFGDADAATATLTASAHVRAAEYTVDRLPSRWRVRLRRVGQRWLVSEIESIPIPPLNLPTVDRWLR